MANDKNKRTIVYIDNDDFDFYQELKKSHYFNDNSFKNLDIFLVSALVCFLIEVEDIISSLRLGCGMLSHLVLGLPWNLC